MEPIMHVREIRKYAEADPFRPFRIRMSDGTVHAVDNPNLLLVTKHTIILGILDWPGLARSVRAKFLSTIPIGRFSTPEDMGNAACYLCSDEASMVTGVAMEVDGGRCI